MKKGIVDPTDLIVIFIFSIILFGVLFLSVQSGNKQSELNSIKLANEYKIQSAALSNLREQLYAGVDLNELNVHVTVANSKVLEGSTISLCSDYTRKEDCNADVAGIRAGMCVWDGEESGKCIENKMKIIDNHLK
jgi:hypothetical protein